MPPRCLNSCPASSSSPAQGDLERDAADFHYPARRGVIEAQDAVLAQ
jgi:hypothetical protein